MKILQIIPTLADGGAERFVVDLCNELIRANHNVMLCTLFTLQGNYQHFKKELLPGIELKSLDKKHGFDASVVFKLKKILKKYSPDIIHTHARALNYLLPLLIANKKHTVVHTVHNDAEKEVATKREMELRYWFYKRKKVAAVTISKESDKSFKKAYPKVSSTVIYNGRKNPEPGIHFNTVLKFIEDAKQNADTKVFLHIGRLMHQKNHLLLLSAFKKLLENNANALLILIGAERDDNESHRIASEIRKACAENKNIIWLGGGQAATDYLMLSQFFCLSSIYEGMPISLIEAFATGCIPVCTPVGGIPEMMDGNGFLAKDVSVDALYDVLMHAYSCSSDELTILKKNFISMYNERFTMKHCVAQYEQLYKNLLALARH